MRRGAWLAALALVALTRATAAAQQTHVLIVTGLGGEPQYSSAFRAAGTQVYDAAKTKWGVAPANLVFLGEDPTADPARISGQSTKEQVEKAFLSLAARVKPGDIIFVFLVGHGSGEGDSAKVNLPGPDPSARDYATWIAGFTRQTVVFVNASSASGDFIKVLAGRGRVIVTATRTAFERNESVFATQFAKGIATGEADADKDGAVSVLEAFDYARREVQKAYDADKKLLTEHATLSDTVLARTVAFGGVAASSDPKIVALVAGRRALQDTIAALRDKKAQMDSTAYEKELERLLIAIAEKNEQIRAAGGHE